MNAPLAGSMRWHLARRPARTALLIGWFTVLWVALWGSLTWANLLGGLAVAVGVLTVARLPMSGAETLGRMEVRPVRALAFLGYFAFKVVQSNVILARQVLALRSANEPGIIAVDLPHCSDAVVTVIANAITLTPGTLTIEVRRHPATVYVHVLDLRDPDAVRAELTRLAELAVRAFGDAAAVQRFAAEANRRRVPIAPEGDAL